MAVVFNWYRGTTAALAEAIRDLDERLAAVEALTAPGTVVAPDAVLATSAFPAHWVQDAILAVAVAGSTSVPSVTVRGAGTFAGIAVAATTAVPTPTVAGAATVAATSVAAVASAPTPTVTVP